MESQERRPTDLSPHAELTWCPGLTGAQDPRLQKQAAWCTWRISQKPLNKPTTGDAKGIPLVMNSMTVGAPAHRGERNGSWRGGFYAPEAQAGRRKLRELIRQMRP